MNRRLKDLLAGFCVSCVLTLVAPSVSWAQPAAGIEALSQSQSLSEAQKGQVATWMNGRFDAVLNGTPAEASAAAQDLIAPFSRNAVTAAFRFAAQDALSPRLRGDLAKGADPAARFAALRMCARVGTTRVRPELEAALGSDDPVERSLAVAAHADFFDTAREAASPISPSVLEARLKALEEGLADEDVPTVASEFVVVLAGADPGETALRLDSSRAMARGLTKNIDRRMPDEQLLVWAVSLTHAVEHANQTYVDVQFGGATVDSGFTGAVKDLCEGAEAFVRSSRNGADLALRSILDDLERRASAVKQRVSG